ncbi:hypothetical protein [Sulfolobus ellipsoid virus 1]|uniref:Uncharacterized protein n=1 Tax=Sulfolobus ellipsoid virus 1 TaxID=2056194 RepID=A0A2H4RBP7_9VIRU|nr:hypothetical protein FGG62_gp27 [Sulfolobus ellipsoid virus 1]ATY46505.1 hypothetical protein [Sulfolobus ellipsoid virus 1]
MIDPSVIANYILSELKQRGINKIDVIGHKKSKVIELRITCENDECYQFVLSRLSLLNDIEGGIKEVLNENKDKIDNAIKMAKKND